MIEIDDRRFNRLALVGLALSLLLLAAAFGAAIYSYVLSRESTGRVRHTYRVVEAISLFETQLERMEAGRRGFLLAQNAYRLNVYRTNARLIPQSIARIEQLVGDNPAHLAIVRRELRPLLDAEMQEVRRSVALATTGRLNEARQRFVNRSQQTAIPRIRALTGNLRQRENRLLAERTAAEGRILQLVNVVLGLTGLLLLLFTGAAFWLVRRYTTDLTAARDRLAVLNSDLEGQVRTRTADLTRANAEIQRFAYIVSHDLRSPLVNILGFTAELETANKTIGKLLERAEAEAPQIVDQDTRHAREDLPEAIGFIRSSTQKMDRLINAILKLSRQGQRTLVAEPLKMSPLLTELARSLEHSLADKGASLTVDPALPDIVADRLAVEQIFSNLMDNAVKYLDPARPGEIGVSGWKDGNRAVFEVRDNGRGIDAVDKERVFDLFRRAGRQDQPGEGIGLAHVRALIYRLGGQIELDSALGVGTTFRVTLPQTMTIGAAQ